MRDISYIAIHCSATPQTTTVESINSYWKRVLGWRAPGYHFIIKANGEVVQLLPIEQISNGVAGYNKSTINICYIGGVDKNNKPIDNRTKEQKASLLKVIKEMKSLFPTATVKGHYQFPNVKKACPSFDAFSEYKLL